MDQQHDDLADFTRDTFTHDGSTKTVYRKGTGPGVVVITEVPGITPDVADFARKLVDRGFTVAMPDLFGEAGRPPSAGYAVKTVAGACVSKEFTLFAKGMASPVTDWLRALGRDLHERAGGPGIGAIGMCLTGGFALAMMAEPSLLAPVLSQPSLPFASVPGRATELGLSDEALAHAKQRCEAEDLCVMGLRFKGDPLVPSARFDRLRQEFGDRFVAIELEQDDANPDGYVPGPAHSVLTTHLIDEPGQPTYEARERVFQLFRDTLQTANA